MSDKNIETVQTIYGAFGRGDVPAIMAHISDDLRHFAVVSELADVPWHVQIKTKKDVPLFFQALAEHTDFTRFEPRDFAATGDHVYCTIAYTATMKKTGKKVLAENAMHHFIFKNGRVVEWHGTEDTAAVHAALHGR